MSHTRHLTHEERAAAADLAVEQVAATLAARRTDHRTDSRRGNARGTDRTSGT